MSRKSVMVLVGGMGAMAWTAAVLAAADLPSGRAVPVKTPQAGIDGAWLARVQADIRRSEYQVSWQERTKLPGVHAAYQAPNRANNFRTFFTDEGVRVIPRFDAARAAPAWEWGLNLIGFGRDGAMIAAGRCELRIDGHRAEYDHGDLVEWYVNDERGLEQGFTIHHRPRDGEGGKEREGNAPLRVDMIMTGNVTVSQPGDGLAVDFFAPNGALAIHFSQLSAVDATGRELSAWFDVHGSTLAIVVDDIGAVYPVIIDPLATTPDWTRDSNQAAAEFGISVAAAGDVNGDGYSDVIVGAHFFDGGNTNEGRAFAFQGTPSGLFPAFLWFADSDQDFAELGLSVSTAGDVNGDGYSDVIVGAPLYSNGQTNEGAAFVWHGSPTFFTTDPNGTPANAVWVAESDQDGASFGSSVATAGDVNGDGYSDVIIGSPFYDDPDADEGAAFVWHGSNVGLGANGTPANAEFVYETNQAGALFGSAVAMAGDVNGDGFSDVTVGAPSFDNSGGNIDGGAYYVRCGSVTGLDTPACGWFTGSLQDGARLGTSVATAGDVNGDGYSDVIYGAPRYDYAGGQDNGVIWIDFGSPIGLGVTGTWGARSEQDNSFFGQSVATAGDVNGDGYSDVIIGALNYDWSFSDEGAAFVWFGKATMADDPFEHAVDADWAASGAQADALYGRSVATAGDVNGDGYSDVIVGSLNYDNGHVNEGQAFVYHGSPAGPQADPGWSAFGGQDNSGFGISVASAGDVNGDGYSDVIVGADFFDNGEPEEGGAFVYFGSSAGPSATPDWSAEGDVEFAGFGHSVASAGDVNGDGYSDVIIGAPYYSDGQSNEGRVSVYLGSPAGPSTTSDWIEEGNRDDAWFGASVATAGDVNGDGYSDIIVGAPTYTNGEANEGRAYVFAGSATGLPPPGLPTTPHWVAESNHLVSRFGTSVATAGDVNGDGFSDVIVGAPFHDQGQAAEGFAFVWFGSDAGLGPNGDPTNAAWTAQSNVLGAQMGTSVATAGDVNCDGYSDIIVGAPLYAGQNGGAFVWHGSPTGFSLGYPPNAQWRAQGDQNGSRFGISVASAGDVNGDGCTEVIIGADYQDYTHSDEGAAYLWLGSAMSGLGPDGFPGNHGWYDSSGQTAAHFGVCVASAGDVNGDGYSDVIVGANDYDDAETNEGGAFLYYGNNGPGASLVSQQRREDDTAAISHLGQSDGPAGFRLAKTGLTPIGGGTVALQWEAKPLGTSMDGMGVEQSAAWMDASGSGADLTEVVTGLAEDTVYHWRFRTRYGIPMSPFQQHGRWISTHGNGWNEADLRTACDLNGDGLADTCNPPPDLLPEPDGVPMGRSVALVVPSSDIASRGPGSLTALRVELISLHHPSDPPQGTPDYSTFEGKIRYVNSFPGGSLDCPDDGPPFDTSYKCATLGCEPEYRAWTAELAAPGPGQPNVPGLLIVAGDAIVPSSTLEVSQIAETCGAAATANDCVSASMPLALSTARWGDITGPAFSPPDGKADVLDIPPIVNKLKGVPTLFPEYRVWLKQRKPTPQSDAITVLDLSDVQDAVLGKPYPASRTIDACAHD